MKRCKVHTGIDISYPINVTEKVKFASKFSYEYCALYTSLCDTKRVQQGWFIHSERRTNLPLNTRNIL
jgi:hypothetical protein